MTAEPLGQPSGATERLVREISSLRHEPAWLLAKRLEALEALPACPLPSWWLPTTDGPVEAIVPPVDPPRRWGTGVATTDLDPEPTTVVDASVAAAEDAALVFQRQLEALHLDGVVFCDLSTAVVEHPDLVRPHLDRLIEERSDRLHALTASAWSGGTFLHVPAGVRVGVPLQSYTRVRSESPDRFERTLIVVGEGASVDYVDGCASPVYATENVRGAIVDIVAEASAQVSYTTVQNWSENVTDASWTTVEANTKSQVVWTAGNIGARRTVRDLTCRLVGTQATGVVRSVGFAGGEQAQDTRIEMIHAAANTRSELISRSVADGDGRVHHNDRLVLDGDAPGSTTLTRRDGLTLGERASVVHTATGDPLPAAPVAGDQAVDRDAAAGQAATASIDEDGLFYLMSRGLTERRATAVMVNGFIDPVIRTLPTEYAVEWSRLIELQIEGAIG